MKKNIFKIMLLLLTIGLMVVSCKKDTPSESNSQQTDKKISKIYRHYLDDSSGDTRYLEQEWHWNSNGNLERIDRFSATGEVVAKESFVYNGNLPVRINFWNKWDGDEAEHYEMQYENGNIMEMRFYYENYLRNSYTLTYTNGHVSNITLHIYETPISKKATDHSDALHLVLPEQLYRIIDAARGKSRGTSQEMEEYVASIALTWSGNNVSRADFLDSNGEGDTSQEQWIMEYDTYYNPYCGILIENIIGERFNYFSTNNVVRITYVFDEGSSGSYTYEYTYENQYVKTMKREGYSDYTEFEYL